MNWAQWISAQWIKKYSVIPAFAGMTVIFLCVKGLSGGLIAADTTVYPQGSGIFSAQAVETPRPPPMDKPRHYRQTCRFKEAPAQSGNMSVSATFKSADPLTFTLFIAGRLPPTYLRYVERSLREKFELGASPIRVRVRVE